jgi:Ca2+-binding RTX toxin-like protein
VIFRGGPSGTVAVFQNGIPIGTFSGVSRVVAHGLGGNDILLADVSIPTQLYGGTGNDWLRGGRAADAIFGDRGRDVILGGAGGDRLRGGGGADVILGGRGTDLLVGGAGIDLMIDETGEDQLVGNAGDILIDGFALIDPTSTALERLFGKLIWNAAGGRRLGTPRPA